MARYGKMRHGRSRADGLLREGRELPWGDRSGRAASSRLRRDRRTMAAPGDRAPGKRAARGMSKRDRARLAAELAAAATEGDGGGEGGDAVPAAIARSARRAQGLASWHRRASRERAAAAADAPAPDAGPARGRPGPPPPAEPGAHGEGPFPHPAGSGAPRPSAPAAPLRARSARGGAPAPGAAPEGGRARRRAASRARRIRGRAAARLKAAARSSVSAASAPRAARAAGAIARRAATFALKGTGALVAAVLPLALAVAAALGLVLMVVASDDATERPAAPAADLPEAVELWRGACRQACIDVIGDEGWTDLMLAMMAQESGGRLDVQCFPGGARRQDIMQACEGAFGSWIVDGGGPYNLEPCTPRASIYAGTAELKQNLDMWRGYLGGIEPSEVDKVKLVVQGYNFGASGWYRWNVRHGYSSYELSRAQNYSDAVMPAGAKGTPAHAELVMRYYSWAQAGTADGSTTVARAYRELGKPYLWGAVGPASYDCSGLVSYCLTGRHERLGNTATFAGWARVDAPVPGDICLNSHHCGVYIGNGKMIHAPRTGDVVKISDVHIGMYYVRY